MRFTDKSIRALAPKEQRFTCWEDGSTGLGVRVGTTGKRTWVFIYRFEGVPRRMTLGVFPKVGLADARLAHAAAKKQFEMGIDPGQIKVQENQTERKAETISDLIDEYMERHARPKKRTADFDERVLRKEVEPEWGKRKAKSIRRRDVVVLLDGVADRGSPVMRNRLQSVMGRMFSVGVRRGILDANPCVDIERLRETPRSRVLDSKEIKTLWNGLGDADMSRLTQLALRLLLVTGQRRQEVTGARRAEILDAECAWYIPAERTKVLRAHKVPLSPLAMQVIQQIDDERERLATIRDTGNPKDSEWLFPSPLSDRPITPASVTRAMRKNRQNMGLGNITPHDFRRTMTTKLSEFGISRFNVERLLNHTDDSTAGRHYDWNDYFEPKRQALEAWAGWLDETIYGDSPPTEKVVPLRTG